MRLCHCRLSQSQNPFFIGSLDYSQDTNIYMKSETHVGEDVRIWAHAHLFRGTHEQFHIAHVHDVRVMFGTKSAALSTK